MRASIYYIIAMEPPRPQGLYFMLNGVEYPPGSTVLIEDIGSFQGSDPSQPGSSLVCVTTNINTQCCRGSDGGNVGEWYYPDGTIVPRNRNPGSSPFSRTASMEQVRLNRRFADVFAPLGEYACRVPDSSGVMQSAFIKIGTGKHFTYQTLANKL